MQWITLRLARRLLAGLLLATGALLPAPALAQPPLAVAPAPPSPHAPPPPTGCVATAHTFQMNTPVLIPDVSTITSTIHVSGIDPNTYDVIALTAISHTYSSDLNVYLLPPNLFGFVDTLTTHNGDGHKNVFANTIWSDQAPYGVAELGIQSDGSLPFTIPEGAMNAAAGHNPNGDWKLVVQDAIPGDTGVLNGWSLVLTTLPFDAPGKSSFPTNHILTPIPNGGTVTSTLTLSGLDALVDNVTVQTVLSHTNSGDIRMVLTSPAGLTTTLVSGQAEGFSGQYEGVTFTDDPLGGQPVTDAVYQNGINLGQVQPVGAMHHFVGTQANGVWKLAITDLHNNLYTGQLSEWQLGVHTSHCEASYLSVAER